MVRQIHIAVLECDTPVAPIVASRGTYGDIFQQLLDSGLSRLGTNNSDVQYLVTKWDVVTAQAYPNIDEVDAFLISGSSEYIKQIILFGMQLTLQEHTAYNDEPWIAKLVEYVSGPLKTGSKPVVGICFGHQIIWRALGAELGGNPAGWEISVSDVQLSEDGQRLFGIPNLVCTPGGYSIQVPNTSLTACIVAHPPDAQRCSS
jgi:GMP synthase-like glutamine amidotransferase